MYVPSTTTSLPWSSGQCHYPSPAERSGWQCPSCGAGNAPDVQQCPCVRNWGRTTGCICPPVWMSVLPPPPCPVHGQAQMLRVTCTGPVSYM